MVVARSKLVLGGHSRLGEILLFLASLVFSSLLIYFVVVAIAATIEILAPASGDFRKAWLVCFPP